MDQPWLGLHPRKIDKVSQEVRWEDLELSYCGYIITEVTNPIPYPALPFDQFEVMPDMVELLRDNDLA